MAGRTFEAHREQDDEHQTEPEGGHGDTDETQTLSRHGQAAEYCRTALRMPSTRPDDKHHRVGDTNQEQRVGQSLQHHVEDVLACVVRRSPVSWRACSRARSNTGSVSAGRSRSDYGGARYPPPSVRRRRCRLPAGRRSPGPGRTDEGDGDQQRHCLDEAPHDVGDHGTSGAPVRTPIVKRFRMKAAWPLEGARRVVPLRCRYGTAALPFR